MTFLFKVDVVEKKKFNNLFAIQFDLKLMLALMKCILCKGIKFIFILKRLITILAQNSSDINFKCLFLYFRKVCCISGEVFCLKIEFDFVVDKEKF